MRIDSHQHFWSYSATEYPWIGTGMECLARDYLPADLVPPARAAGIGGTVAVWLMNGATALSSRALPPTGLSSPTTAWSIVATLSAGSNGRPGIVVRETTSGRTMVWWMDGVAIDAAAPLGGDGRVALLRRSGRIIG